MINSAPVITVYEMEDTTLETIGVLQDYTSIMYNPKFDDVGTFTLKVPFSKKNFELLCGSEGFEKIIYIEDGIVGICQKLSCDITSKASTLTVKGFLGEGFLDNAILHELDYKLPGEGEERYDIQDHIQHALDTSILLKGTLWGAINFVQISTDDSFIPNNNVIAGRSTFGEFIRTLCKACNKGYKVRFNQTTRQLDFSLCNYTDRGMTSSEPVYISRELVSLGDTKFTINSQSYKNMLYAWTEFTTQGGQSALATLEIDYNEPDKRPHSKKEIRADYVKIDISSDETIQDIPEGYSRLSSKGKQALYDAAYIKSYDCEVKGQQTNNAYNFGKDYFLGDIVAVKDSQLGITVDVKLLEYTKTIDLKGSFFDPVFGVSQPTLNRVLRKNKIIR